MTTPRPRQQPGDAAKLPTLPTLPLSRALAGSEPLAGLLQRVDESRRRLAAITSLLPEPLRASVRAGPLDEKAWALLVDNAAAAAKLRQLLPALEAGLRAQGWQGPEVKIRILPRG